jgi:hypothetical protein
MLISSSGASWLTQFAYHAEKIPRSLINDTICCLPLHHFQRGTQLFVALFAEQLLVIL